MADLPTSARVVIIGGGAVGVSALYHLAKAGWTDCVLLEKNELTAGSTWHAAGNIPTFSNSWVIANMQRYSTELYRRLGEEVDYPMNYHVTDSVRLAHSKQRMQEFERAAGMARMQGMEYQIVSPAELKERYPFIETHDLEGALCDKYDGDIDPAQLTQALAKGARDLGAKIVRFCPATGARRDGDEWIVETEQGEIRCEFVVNAAGYYAREVGKWFGRDVPMIVMSHQYMLTDEIPEIEAWSKETGRKLPLLRDVDSSYYLRQEKNGLNLGPYELNCKAAWRTQDDPMPDDFSFQLFPDDLDRLEWYIEDAMERVPILGTAGVNRVINGPIPYSPDGNPLIGPMPGVPNAFEACVFTFGIAQAGGAGKVLCEYITEGAAEWDAWGVDPRRFTGWCDQDYCEAKAMEIYGHEYAMHFPTYSWPDGRFKRLSPVHDRLESMGAQFGAYNGWERALWFAKDGDDVSLESREIWEREGPWFPRVREECHAVRDAAGILDISGFTRIQVSGPGARDWLSGMTTGKMPSAGRIGLAYFADEKGRIITEMSVMAEEDGFLLIGAAPAEWHDRDWLTKHLPTDGSVTLKGVTEEYCCHLLTGPKARDILAGITTGDLSNRWLTHQNAEVAGRPCRLARVSFAGELGWEIHTAIDDTATVYDAVMKTGASYGLQPIGMFALDSLRLEKGYRGWKSDLSTDYNIWDAGLDRFVDTTKETFIGRDAIISAGEPTKQFVAMTIEGSACDAPYMSGVYKGDEIVGEITSSGWGHRIDKALGLGTLRADVAAPGTTLEVDIFGERFTAIVQDDLSTWDPKNERVRDQG